MAAPKLGSGTRFKKLSGALARRGASNPDALAAYIGRKKYSAGGMAKLSAGKSLANDDLGIYLAVTTKDEQGQTLTCPECDYSGPASSFGANGASLQPKPEDLRTPAPGTGAVRDGVPLTVKGNAAHALAGDTRRAVELATGTARRVPVHGPYDVGVRRSEGGPVLYHRRSGGDIAKLRKNDDGTWTAVVGGKELQPHAQQRVAMIEAVDTYNKVAGAGVRAQPAPLQQEPQQTPLMAEYGIPAMRSAAFATPMTSSASGPRMTTAGGTGSDDDDSDSGGGGTDANGLNAKGQAIYKKLMAKGFPQARALAFARNSQKAKPGQFGKSAAA
jgi:hypothetical protein